MKRIILLSLCFLLMAPSVTQAGAVQKKPHAKNHYGFLVETKAKRNFKFVKGTSARWTRPHPGPFIWGSMQEDADAEYDFTQTDKWVKRAQKRNLSMLVTLWPYAEWDQLNHENHDECIAEEGMFEKQMTLYRCNPENWKAYKRWVRAVVERYDGDGKNDMPGLKRKIRHWEVNNEPDLDVFYKGTPGNYRKLLAQTSTAIRKSNRKAKVVIAGAASSEQFSEDFFTEVFSKKKVKQRFDIGNVHCIGGSCDTTDFNASWYKQLLTNNGMPNKKFWITEAQAYISEDLDVTAAQYLESTSNARAAGANKIFMTHMSFEKPDYEQYVDVDPEPTAVGGIDGNTPKLTFKEIFQRIQ